MLLSTHKCDYLCKFKFSRNLKLHNLQGVIMTIINAIIGDISYFKKNRHNASNGIEDQTQIDRITTHLDYMYNKLKNQNVLNNPNRDQHLYHLMEYIRMEKYPRHTNDVSTSFTSKSTMTRIRSPLVQDSQDTYCAVGYLIANTNVPHIDTDKLLTDLIENDNESYFTPELLAKYPALKQWIDDSGFTPLEIASIQPRYRRPSWDDLYRRKLIQQPILEQRKTVPSSDNPYYPHGRIWQMMNRCSRVAIISLIFAVLTVVCTFGWMSNDALLQACRQDLMINHEYWIDLKVFLYIAVVINCLNFVVSWNVISIVRQQDNNNMEEKDLKNKILEFKRLLYSLYAVILVQCGWAIVGYCIYQYQLTEKCKTKTIADTMIKCWCFGTVGLILLRTGILIHYRMRESRDKL